MLKEKKVKDCIELMKGVLEEIQNEKKGDNLFKSVKYSEKEKEGGKESTFERYVKNVCRIKSDNKIILLKRGKSKSNVNEQVRSSACLLYTSPSPRDLSTSRMPSSA